MNTYVGAMRIISDCVNTGYIFERFRCILSLFYSYYSLLKIRYHVFTVKNYSWNYVRKLYECITPDHSSCVVQDAYCDRGIESHWVINVMSAFIMYFSYPVSTETLRLFDPLSVESYQLRSPRIIISEVNFEVEQIRSHNMWELRGIRPVTVAVQSWGMNFFVR
jgi:hypothetical protein